MKTNFSIPRARAKWYDPVRTAGTRSAALRPPPESLKKKSRHFRPAFSQSTDCTFRCVCPLSGSYEIFPFYYDSASCVATLGRKANIWISWQPATLECLKTFLRSVNKNLEGNIWWPDAPISTFFKRNSMYRLNCYFGGLFGLLSFYRFSQWPA